MPPIRTPPQMSQGRYNSSKCLRLSCSFCFSLIERTFSAMRASFSDRGLFDEAEDVTVASCSLFSLLCFIFSANGSRVWPTFTVCTSRRTNGLSSSFSSTLSSLSSTFLIDFYNNNFLIIIYYLLSLQVFISK